MMLDLSIDTKKTGKLILIKPKLLCGEGKEEENFFEALVKHLRIDDIQITSYGGKDKNRFREFLASLHIIPGYNQLKSIGITRDADTNPAISAFNSICSSLAKTQTFETNIPKFINSHSHGKPHISIFILPDCQNFGALERLCLSAMTDSVVSCIDKFFKCVGENSRNENDKAKAQIHAWLATLPNPNLRLGEAALQGYIDFTHPVFNKLVDFVKNL